jgi:hypothetical protein
VPEQTQIQGFQVELAGTYVLLSDVVAALRAYAQSLEDPNDGAAVHGAVGWLEAGSNPEVQEPVTEAAEAPYGAEADDVSEGVARVEVYPDPPNDPRPKWYARTVDTSGYIIKVTDGSYDQEFVIRNAEQRFSGVPILLLKHAGEDSKYMEDSTRGVFPSIGPPVRRLWSGIPEADRTVPHSQLGAPQT